MDDTEEVPLKIEVPHLELSVADQNRRHAYAAIVGATNPKSQAARCFVAGGGGILGLTSRIWHTTSTADHCARDRLAMLETVLLLARRLREEIADDPSVEHS
jgi:hypothetical protein